MERLSEAGDDRLGDYRSPNGTFLFVPCGGCHGGGCSECRDDGLVPTKLGRGIIDLINWEAGDE